MSRRLSRHLLVDPLKPFHESPDVVVAISVAQMSSMISAMVRTSRSGGSAVIAVAVLEIFQQCPVEAVEHHEVRLVRKVVSLASSASQHLFKQDSDSSQVAGRQCLQDQGCPRQL